jgi:hypothetical protein
MPSRYEVRIYECLQTLRAGSDWGSVSADSDDRDPCSQIAVLGHAKNSPGVLLRFFLSTEPLGWPKNELCWKEFDPIIRHVIVLSVSFGRTP